ncbi:MAG TPA: hypothetical protein VNJ04_20630, partial [Gemmatimonadaceae bacterium]|nr:hypothetical protein [Gemmatimonadaceae bacterium]
STPVKIPLPASLATGSYTLSGAIVRGADTLSRNQTSVFIAARSFRRAGRAGTRRIVVHDSSGTTFRALTLLGVRASRSGTVSALSPTRDLLVIGADSWTGELARQTADLRTFIARGGRVLVLHQNSRFDGSWLPAPVRVTTGELDHSVVMPGNRPYRNGMAVNPERADHPVLAGIDRDRLFLWSDYTGWDESKPGFPEVYPVTRGFALSDARSLSRAAVIANYDHGLEGIAIAELFDGEGSAMMTGMNLVDRAGRDPVADRLLLNLLGYMGSVTAHRNELEFSSKIVWGDYASERGLLTGIYNGLIVNTVPRVPADLKKVYPVTVDANGFVYAGGSGGWNTKPAIQYFARGRRPFGPYSFSYGGSVVLPTNAARMGEGRVVLRVPAARRTMLTTVSNPVKEELPLEIEVNGARQAFTIAPGDSTQVRTAVRGGALPLQIVFRGDRRLVLLETDFR